MKALSDFVGARRAAHPADRLTEVRMRARRFNRWFGEGPTALYYRTFDLIRVPYPVRYGLLNACRVPIPFLHILNRLFVVQYRSGNRVRTLLFSPSDFKRNRETPFFKRLGESFGPFQKWGEKLIAPISATVEECLASINILPEHVDYISYDHLHTQDIRRWLGTATEPAAFPNAKLLVMRQEWESTLALLPPQRDWYCPHGIEGIDPKKIILLEGDVQLGEGVALIGTPGHTEGNHSLVVNTNSGVLVSSENGISADSYSPLESRIPGVRNFALQTGMEVILNGNTLERGLDQYVSMIQEKEMAGVNHWDARFYNVIPSSELTAYWAFPGIRPTYRFSEQIHGEPQITTRSARSSAA